MWTKTSPPCLDPRIHTTPRERILQPRKWHQCRELGATDRMLLFFLLYRYFKKSRCTKIIHSNSAIGLFFKIRLQESAKINDPQIIQARLFTRRPIYKSTNSHVPLWGGLLVVRIMVQQRHLPHCYRAVLPAWWTEEKRLNNLINNSSYPYRKDKRERLCGRRLTQPLCIETCFVTWKKSTGVSSHHTEGQQPLTPPEPWEPGGPPEPPAPLTSSCNSKPESRWATAAGWRSAHTSLSPKSPPSAPVLLERINRSITRHVGCVCVR